MAANPELTQYVAAHRAAGRSDAEIATELQTAGWDSTNINLAMNLDESILPPPIPPSATAGIELAGAIVGSPLNDFKLELSDVGWSWGAFSLTWLWGVVNKVWLALAFLIPGINVLIALPLGIYVGVKGRRLAFENKKFNDIEDFRATQKAWDLWGIITFAVSLLLSVSLVLFIVSATGKDSMIYKEFQKRIEQQSPEGQTTTEVLTTKQQQDWANATSDAIDAYFETKGTVPTDLKELLATNQIAPPPTISGKAIQYTYTPNGLLSDYALTVPMLVKGTCSANAGLYTVTLTYVLCEAKESPGPETSATPDPSNSPAPLLR